MMIMFLVNLAGEIALLTVVMVVLESVQPSHRQRWKQGLFIQALVIAALGVFLGLMSVALFPKPLLTRLSLAGASLVLVPLAAGLAMRYFGLWCARRNKPSDFLATFWGGALFTLALSSARFLMIRHAF